MKSGKDLPGSNEGDKVPVTPQTGLKTLDGHIRLGMADGSIVILDTLSAIQFSNPGLGSDKTGTFFDHLYGKALLINGQRTPGQSGIRLPNGITVNVAQSIVGIEFHPEIIDPLEVDCLAGACQVTTQKDFDCFNGRRAHPDRRRWDHPPGRSGQVHPLGGSGRRLYSAAPNGNRKPDRFAYPNGRGKEPNPNPHSNRERHPDADGRSHCLKHGQPDAHPDAYLALYPAYKNKNPNQYP